MISYHAGSAFNMLIGLQDRFPLPENIVLPEWLCRNHPYSTDEEASAVEGVL